MRERTSTIKEEKRVPKQLEEEKELSLSLIFIPFCPCNFEVFSKVFISLINCTLQLCYQAVYSLESFNKNNFSHVRHIMLLFSWQDKRKLTKR